MKRVARFSFAGIIHQMGQMGAHGNATSIYISGLKQSHSSIDSALSARMAFAGLPGRYATHSLATTHTAILPRLHRPTGMGPILIDPLLSFTVLRHSCIRPLTFVAHMHRRRTVDVATSDPHDHADGLARVPPRLPRTDAPSNRERQRSRQAPTAQSPFAYRV